MYYLFSLQKKKSSTFEGVISTNKFQLTHFAFIFKQTEETKLDIKIAFVVSCDFVFLLYMKVTFST